MLSTADLLCNDRTLYAPLFGCRKQVKPSAQILILLAVSVIMRGSTSKDVNLLVYLEVFTLASTVVIIAIIAAVALLFTCLSCFDKRDSLHADPDREEFNLLTGLALAAGILGQLGYPIGENSTV